MLDSKLVQDIAAGVVIVEEAGGVISNIDGEPLDICSRQILASNPTLHWKFVVAASNK